MTKVQLLRCHFLVLFFLVPFTSFASAFDQPDLDKSHPVVPGFERFREVEEIGDAERGMLLLNELNCVSCHQGESSWPTKSKQAPILSEIGSRVLSKYFVPFLLDPHSVKPGTTMPNVLAGENDAEKKEVAESIAHFLASTGSTAKQNSTTSYVKLGESLFHSVGCVACHDPQNEDVSIATSIPLGKLEDKFTLPGLTNFIKNPLHVRPSGRMPQFNLSEQEAQSIAAYLLRAVVSDTKINYAYYPGKWEKLPKFDQLEPTESGMSSGFEVNIGPDKDNFGMVFTGYWTTARDAKYKFRIGSDDGSRLKIDGKTIVNNNGIHGVEFKEKSHEINAGVHKVVVEFFEAAGGEELKVQVFGEGLAGVSLASLMRPTKEEPVEEGVEAFVLDPKKVKLGRSNFMKYQCASCHEMVVNDVMLTSSNPASPRPLAKSLKNLGSKGGCLTGAGNAVDFNLTQYQSDCLVAAINRFKNPSPRPVIPEQVVHEKLTTLNCYACHDRDRTGEYGRYVVGGVIDKSGESFEVFGRKKWFTSTQAEIGDEGQHPPSLKSVGSKLNPKWMHKVLNEGIKSRPYMLTRMPKFGGKQNFGELANELRKVDALTDVPVVTQTESEREVKALGRFFAGEEALSCIKCHTFGSYDATGIQAIDLTTMTERLNKDWFHAYMLKPSNFRRGTRMPESWPGGQTFYKDVLDGDSAKQIDSIWQFLSDGKEAAKPKGLVRTKNELKAVDTPIIYRNFIEGAGSRAIGVAYPEQVNLAFDAENCCISLIWQENFIDASRHWVGRGQGFEAPLGENVLKFPRKFQFRLADKVGEEDAKTKFKGYFFDEQRRPTFIYQIGDVAIQDQPIPFLDPEGRPLLNRKISIVSTSSKSIDFRVSMGQESKTELVNGKQKIWNERLRTNVSCTADFETASEGNQTEFTLTIDLSSGKATIMQSFEW